MLSEVEAGHCDVESICEEAVVVVTVPKLTFSPPDE